DAHAGGEALDAVEQERRALRRPGRDLGDAADLEARVGAVDPPQRAKLVHLLDEAAQILVDHTKTPVISATGSIRPQGTPHALHRCLQSFQSEALSRRAAAIAG